jgi:hypothetical protein
VVVDRPVANTPSLSTLIEGNLCRQCHPSRKDQDYRQGILYLGDEYANLGLISHTAALEWVMENIAAPPPTSPSSASRLVR